MDRLSAEAMEAAVGQGPARAGCLRAVRAFSVGARGGLDTLAGVERAFGFEGLGFACRQSGAPRPALEGWQADFFAVGAGFALAAGVVGVPEGPHEWEGLGFGLALLRASPWRLRWDDPALRHGAGRALWFRRAGALDAIARDLQAFTPAVRWDLVQGVGFAAAFSCGADRELLARWPPAGLVEPLAEGLARGMLFRANLSESPSRPDSR